VAVLQKYRGFMLLILTHAEAHSKWIFVDTVKNRNYSVATEQGKVLKVLPGQDC